MSATDPYSEPTDRRAELPTFDLAYDVDDTEDPTRVVVYAESDESIATQWISIEADRAVDLDDVA